MTGEVNPAPVNSALDMLEGAVSAALACYAQWTLSDDAPIGRPGLLAGAGTALSVVAMLALGVASLQQIAAFVLL